MFHKPQPFIAVGDAPSTCGSFPPRVGAWCGITSQEKITQFHSAKLRHSHHSLMMGTNGQYAAALRCINSDVLIFKENLGRWEQNAVYQHLTQTMQDLQTKKEAKNFCQLLKVILLSDPTLFPVADYMEKVVEAKMPDLSDDDMPFMLKQETNARIGKEHISIEQLAEDLPSSSSSSHEACSVVSYFLCICPIPTTKKKRQWRDGIAEIRVRTNTYPIGVMNDTHMMVVYCDADHSNDMFDLTCAYWCFPNQHGKVLPVPEWTVRFRLSKTDSKEGVLVHAALDKSTPRCVIGIASFLYVIDPRKDGKQGVFQLSHESVISCVSICEEETILAGTMLGEVCRFNLRNPKDVMIHNVPKLEPIFQIQWLPKEQTICMMTCMGMYLETTHGRLQVNSLRPTGCFIDSQMMVTHCKYGFIQLRPLNVTSIVCRIDPLDPKKQKIVTTQQPFFNSIHMSERRMVTVDDLGEVRVWNADF